MSGRVMAIVPGETPCLRCLFPTPPAAGELETCDTAGVLAATAGVVASLQVAAGMRLLVGAGASEQITTLDVWANRMAVISTAGGRRADCPACGQRAFAFLDRPASGTTTLCGRDAIQVLPSSPTSLDPARMAARLASAGEVESTPYLLRCTLRESGLGLTIFRDGRAIVRGTTDPAVARSVYARYIGT
jgi:adenylyltransferase/sulfurtransferase